MGQWAALGVAAVIVLGGGAVVATKVLGEGLSPNGTSSTMSPSSTTSVSGASSGVGEPTATATAIPASDTSAAQSALQSCQNQIRAGNALADAAADSARDWSAHAGAQISLDAGKISYATAERIWKASKKPAAADLANFAAAKAAYSTVHNGCAPTEAATKGTSLASAAAACIARSKALDAVARSGNAVNTQWAAHVSQMKTKATAAGPLYHEKWMNYVAYSKPVLVTYHKDAAALKAAPACI